MPLPNDPAYQDWAWFPHGSAQDFKFTKCMETLEPLRDELTILSGFSHVASRNVHGHNNADQFLTVQPLVKATSFTPIQFRLTRYTPIMLVTKLGLHR